MPKWLTDLNLNEISLVDDPANEDARVEIVKAKGGIPERFAHAAGAIVAAIEELAPEIVEKALAGGFPAEGDNGAAEAADYIKEIVMNLEELTKALETAEQENSELKKGKETAEAAKKKAEDDLAKAKSDLEAKDAEIAKAKGSDEPSEEEIMKSLPASIRKRLEDQDAEIKKAREQEEKAERDSYIAKAKDMKAPDPEKTGDLLHRIAKGKSTAEDVTALEGVLKQASAQADASSLFKSIGSGKDDDGPDGEDVLTTKAKEIQAASNGEMTFAEAFDKALTANPQAYDAYVAKRR